jgi:hypothetical protein
VNPKPTWLVPAVLILVGLLCVFLVVFIIVATVRDRRRKVAELRAAAEAMGLSFMPKGDKDFAAAWSVIKPLHKGGAVTNVVFGTLASGPTVTAFKHFYVVSTGQGAHVVHHAVVAVDTPAWPRVEIKRRNAVMKWLQGALSRKKTGPSAPDSDGAGDGRATFDREWVVDAEDAAFAESLLTEAVCMAMSLHEKAVAWWFVGGKVAVLRSDALTPDLLAESIAQIESVSAAMPDDLKRMSGTPEQVDEA